MRKKLLILLTLTLLLSVSPVQVFAKTGKMDSKPIQNYIATHKGIVGVYYLNTVTGDSYSYQTNKVTRAASTIKLPLVTYIMELASKHKIDLNKKLTYYRYEYNGGSGIIQYHKVGSKYTIGQLVKYAVEYSDNIAFVMLRNYVGNAHFIAYCQSIGGKHLYTNGVNVTTANDLAYYMKHYLAFSKSNNLGKVLDGYLTHTIYNDYIPKGLPKGVVIAHKVGMIPEDGIYNDVAYIKDRTPYVLIVLTKDKKGPTTISGLSKLVYQQHLKANPMPLTNPLKTSQIQITNNKGKPDVVKITGLTKEDQISLYTSSQKKTLIGRKKSFASVVTLSIKQLGMNPGTIYITVQHPGRSESRPLSVPYQAEPK